MLFMASEGKDYDFTTL